MTRGNFVVVEAFQGQDGNVIVVCNGEKDRWRPGQRVLVTRPDGEAMATTVVGVDYSNPPLPAGQTSILVGPEAARHVIPGATVRLGWTRHSATRPITSRGLTPFSGR